LGTWPKYFIASEEPQLLPDLNEAPLRFAVDSFRAAFPSAHENAKAAKPRAPSEEKPAVVSDWIVATDANANLRLLSGHNRSKLPPDLQKQLNTHELLAPTRTLNVKQLFLFHLEYAETQGNPPGLNDPIHLQGRIFGPFPSEQPRCASGQLTVTRADLLDGMLSNASCAFQYADVHRSGAGVHRCLHALLPGSSTQELESGCGAILLFPMLGAALSCGDPVNQTFAAGLLYDVLVHLQADFLQDNILGAFPELKLPVPSRRLHEARLRAHGHEIRGDTVYAPIPKPSRSWLGQLFQNLVRKTEKLPPEGTFADFLRVARVALLSMPGWPDARVQALRGLTRFHALTWTVGDDAMLRPIEMTKVEPHVASFKFDESGVLSPAKPARETERFICFQVEPAFAFRRHADVDIQIEYQGGPGEFCVDSFQDSPLPKGRMTAPQRMDASREWKTASISTSNILLDRRFWNDADFALVVRSKKDFRLRRLTISGRGTPEIDLAPAATIHSHLPSRLKSETCQGWLDELGRWRHMFMESVLIFPRKPGFDLRFRGWIIDPKHKNAEGSQFFVLKSGNDEFAFPAHRSSRPDVARQHGNVEAYTHSGLEGGFATDSVPVGEYRAFLRLVRPDGLSCVEVDTTRRLRFYDDVSLESVAKPDSRALCVEPVGPYWCWGIDIQGFDPCFRTGCCSGSGELAFRVWLKKGRAYQLAVGLMEPQVEQRDTRLVELIVGGRNMGKLDLVAHPGTRCPYVVIVPASRLDCDGWIEIKIARHRDSKADHNVLMYGIWVFAEGETIDEESVARGIYTDRALLYWPCGSILKRCTEEVLGESLKRLELKAGRDGVEIAWQGNRVSREGPSDAASIAAAFFLDQHLQPPVFNFGPGCQPDRANEFLQQLWAMPTHTLLALAISGTLHKGLLSELKEALRGWGIQCPLPGESGKTRRNLLVVGVKGLSPNYTVEMEGVEDLAYPLPAMANPGLIGHWKLNDAGKKIIDSSGRGHHGALKGGKWHNATDGSLLEFDGSGFITIPYHADFHIPGDLTLSLWMRPSVVPERDVLAAGRGDPCRPVLFWWNRTHIVFSQCNRHGQGITWAGAEGTRLGKWRHVTAVVSGQAVILYIDASETRRDSRRGVPGTSSAPFTIGGFENNYHPYFKGNIQDVRLYNRALSADEVLQVYNEMPKSRLQNAPPKRPRRKKPEK